MRYSYAYTKLKDRNTCPMHDHVLYMLSFFVLCTLALFSITNVAHAQCISGMPCVEPLTPNDPYDGTISPNENGPNAAKTTSDICDADFMNQIYSRAFIESARENVLNQILIRKPDSVIEYSCYDQPVSMTAEIAGPLFTETDWFWDREVEIDGRIGEDTVDNVTLNVHMCDGDNPCDKLDISLEKLVLYALKEFVDENFWHDFLGGSIPGIDGDIQDSIRDHYLCDYMSITHFMAKCEDIATDDQFFSFSTLTNYDPRLLPEQCSGTDITQDRIDVANNEGYQYADIDAIDETYEDLRTPNTCSSPIPTGMEVVIDKSTIDNLGNTTNTKDTYDEHMCSNPGCHYNYDSGQCET